MCLSVPDSFLSSHTAPAAEAKKEEEPEAEESDEDMGFSEYRLVSTSYLVLIVYSTFYNHFCFICLWVKEKLLHMLENLHEQDHLRNNLLEGRRKNKKIFHNST